jgi:hypothetical protein
MQTVVYTHITEQNAGLSSFHRLSLSLLRPLVSLNSPISRRVHHEASHLVHVRTTHSILRWVALFTRDSIRRSPMTQVVLVGVTWSAIPCCLLVLCHFR